MAGQIRLPYIRPHQKRINALINSKTTINHHASDWLMSNVSDSLQGSHLEAIYSIPTNKKNATVADICMVHIIDQSGLVIVEKKTGVVGSTEDQLLDIADKMVLELPQRGYVVIIKTVRGGVAERNDVEINATHAMEAVASAILTLATEFYEDLPMEGYKNTVMGGIQDCVTHLQEIIIKLDNQNTYQLKAVAPTNRFTEPFAVRVHKLSA
jgi:hypothetical protein